MEETIKSLKEQVNLLRYQLGSAPTPQQVAELQAECERLRSESDACRNDNLALRKNLSDYLMSTDGGKAALREFNIMLVASQIEAMQARLAELNAN